MRKTCYYSAFLLIALGLYGCEKKDAKEDTPAISEVAEITLEMETNTWVYYSLSENKAVGTSRFLDNDQDAEWSKRGDWDIAFCNGFIKTNSGTSGEYAGGIQESGKEFELMVDAPCNQYIEDKLVGGPVME